MFIRLNFLLLFLKLKYASLVILKKYDKEILTNTKKMPHSNKRKVLNAALGAMFTLWITWRKANRGGIIGALTPLKDIESSQQSSVRETLADPTEMKEQIKQIDQRTMNIN